MSAPTSSNDPPIPGCSYVRVRLMPRTGHSQGAAPIGSLETPRFSTRTKVDDPVTSSTTSQTPHAGARRNSNVVVGMVVALAFSYGLQMYASVPAFPVIAADFDLRLSSVSLLVSAFFLGYAVAHVPAGFAGAAYGFKVVAVSGAGLLAASSALFAVSNSFALLLVSRLLGGVAMSMMVGTAIPIAAGWARPDRVRITVGGWVQGLGFTAGAAVALYAWTFVNESLGWRSGMWVAAMIGLVATVLAAVLLVNPPNAAEHEEFSWTSTTRCLRSKSMWTIGLGSVGAYGGLFTVSQLGPGYAVSDLGLTASTAGLLSGIMLFLGIPGSILSGYIADRSKRFIPVLLVPATLMVLCMFVLPFSTAVTFSIAIAGIGFLGSMYFAIVVVAPGEYEDEISPRDYGTALGLILTLGNAGAVLFPYVYGVMAEKVASNLGWLALAIIAAAACVALAATREPRVNANREL